MAVKLHKRTINTSAVEVISEHDDAVDMDKSDWDEYMKTGDTNKLAFVPGKQPTIFLCSFDFKGGESAFVKDAMLGGKDADGAPKIALGSWSFRIAKTALKDIKNPDDVPEDERIIFVKDKSGYASDDLLALLDKIGVVNQIMALYNASIEIGTKAHSKN